MKGKSKLLLSLLVCLLVCPHIIYAKEKQPKPISAAKFIEQAKTDYKILYHPPDSAIDIGPSSAEINKHPVAKAKRNYAVQHSLDKEINGERQLRNVIWNSAARKLGVATSGIKRKEPAKTIYNKPTAKDSNVANPAKGNKSSNSSSGGTPIDLTDID